MEISYRVPFYPQHWNLADWQELGFKDEEEAKYWQDSSCGILCLKMALEALEATDKSIPISELVKMGLEKGAYTHKYGWSHEGLCRLAEHFGARAISRNNLTAEEIKRSLDSHSFPIVSIKWAFENSKTFKERLLFWKKYGGHLALVIGYSSQGFIVHHTSTKKEFNWENKLITFQDFTKGFTGRGVVVSLKKTE